MGAVRPKDALAGGLLTVGEALRTRESSRGANGGPGLIEVLAKSAFRCWSAVGRLRPWAAMVSFDQRHFLFVLVAVVLGLIVVGPLVVLVASSLDARNVIPFPPGDISLENYETAYSSTTTYQVLWNTIQYATGSVVLGLFLGLVASWLIGRTDLPWRDAIFAIATAAFAMPPLLTGFGWTLLASPRNGVLNILLREITGPTVKNGPIDVYTMAGMIFVTGIAMVPSVMVLLTPLLAALDRRLEEAATTSGATTLKTLRHVTLPLIVPGIAAAFIYFAIVSIQILEIPVAIGFKAGVSTLSTYIFLLTQPLFGTVRYGLATAFSIMILIAGFALVMVYHYITRQGRRFEVLGGKGYRADRVALGKWKYLALGLVLGIFFLSPGLPFSILLWTALAPPYVQLSLEAFSALSFDAFADVLSSPRIIGSMGNTVILIFASAALTMVLASLVAWLSHRSQVRGARLLDQLAFMPLSMPGIVVGLALALLLARTPLYGTIWIIVLGHVIHFLPFGVRIMGSSIMQIDKELEEAGFTCGAKRFVVFQRLTLPLVFPAFANGWAWVLGHSLRDFTFPLMLGTTQNAVVATMIWERWNQPDTRTAAALSVLVIVVLGALLFSIRRFSESMWFAGRPNM